MNERKTMSDKETFFHFIMRHYEPSEDYQRLRFFLLTQVPMDLRDAFDLAAGAWMTLHYLPDEEGQILQTLYETIVRLWKQYSNIYPEVEPLVFPPDKRFIGIPRFHIYHTFTHEKENSTNDRRTNLSDCICDP